MIGADFLVVTAFLLALGGAGFAWASGFGSGLGKGRGSLADEPAAERWLLGFLVAFSVMGWWLYACDLLGIAWSRPMLIGVGIAAGALAVASLARSRSHSTGARISERSPAPRSASGMPLPLPLLVLILGLAIVLGAVLVFTVSTIGAFAVQPDYVYHWGPKAQRFYLEQGIDWQYLARPWNHHLHPDYPNLVPALTAASLRVGVAGATTGPLPWSAVAPLPILFMALLAVALWQLMRRCLSARGSAPSDPPPLSLFGVFAVGIAIWGMVGFAIGHELAGGADLPLALAVAAGALALVRPPARLANPGGATDTVATETGATDTYVAWVAAFAAGIKIEGMVLGVVLVGLHVLRRSGLVSFLGSGEAGGTAGRVLSALALVRIGWRSSWPLLVTLGFWAWGVLGHGLFLESNTGQLDLGRITIIVPELARTLSLAEGLGLPLFLLAWPCLLFTRESRLPALLIGAQLAFYLYAYLSGPVDTAFWIRTSAPRLAFHVLPTLVVLLVLELDRRTG